MARATIVISLLAMCIASIQVTARAQDTDLKNIDLRKLLCDRETRKRVDDAWEACHQIVTDTLDQSEDDLPIWAGRYYCGDGLGHNESFVLSPERSYTYRLRGCMGVFDQNFGEIVELEDGSIALTQEVPSMKPWNTPLGQGYYPITWGSRQYLVPTNEVGKFCDAIMSGDEPRDRAHGDFLLRSGDHELPVTGPPGLPEGFRSIVLEFPLSARIVDVYTRSEMKTGTDDRVVFTWPVRIDAGGDRGVRDGLRFYVIEPQVAREWRQSVLRITSVGGDVSMGEIRSTAKRGAPALVPERGWLLSTERAQLDPGH